MVEMCHQRKRPWRLVVVKKFRSQDRTEITFSEEMSCRNVCPSWILQVVSLSFVRPYAVIKVTLRNTRTISDPEMRMAWHQPEKTHHVLPLRKYCILDSGSRRALNPDDK